MKLTAAQLRSIIKEETKRALREGPEGPGSGPLPEPRVDPDITLMRSAEALEKIVNDLEGAFDVFPRSDNYSSASAVALKSVINAVGKAASDLYKITG